MTKHKRYQAQWLVATSTRIFLKFIAPIIFHLCCNFCFFVLFYKIYPHFSSLAQNLMIAWIEFFYKYICCCYNLKNFVFLLHFYTSVNRKIQLKCEIKVLRQINAIRIQDLAFLNINTFVGRIKHSFINDFHDFISLRGGKRISFDENLLLLNFCYISYLIQIGLLF